MSTRNGTLREGLCDLGARNCGTPQGALEMFLLRGRALILQTFPGPNGCELYAPVTRCNKIADTLKAADAYTQRKADPSLTYAELSTILAALRYWQSKWSVLGSQYTSGAVIPEALRDHFEGTQPLDVDEIDSLCERLNCGEIVTITGGPKE